MTWEWIAEHLVWGFYFAGMGMGWVLRDMVSCITIRVIKSDERSEP